jgi:hypothetical protein
VRGSVRYRSTFTSLCNVTAEQMDDPDFAGCDITLTNVKHIDDDN